MFPMPVHSTIEAADCPAAEQLLLTIGRAGVLSSRAIAAEELETLLRLLGPPSERQRKDLKRATDIVLIENGALIYWPRTGEQFADAAYAMARVQATLARMSTATLKRELALLRRHSTFDSRFLLQEHEIEVKPCTADPARKAAASGAAASGLLRYPLGAPDMERLECSIDAKASISVPWRSCSATPRSSARTPPSVIARERGIA